MEENKYICICGKEFKSQEELLKHRGGCQMYLKEITVCLNSFDEIPVGKGDDISGKRFGSLVALYRTTNQYTKSGRQLTRWVCRCDCGEMRPFLCCDIVGKTDCSCGCLNRKKASLRMQQYNADQSSVNIGDRFSMLVVIKDLGLRKQKSRNKMQRWVSCKCDCGNTTECSVNQLVSGGKKSCGCMHSYGEHLVQRLFEENSIKFVKEYSFEDLVSPHGFRLRFDFAVLDKFDCIEFLVEVDGKQHFTGPEGIWKNTYNLEDQKIRDQLKNDYCIQNGIVLKRIPFTDLKKLNIEVIYSDYYNI